MADLKLSMAKIYVKDTNLATDIKLSAAKTYTLKYEMATDEIL
jgi:hypothetical protein